MASMRTWSGSSPSTPAQGWSRDVTENIANELRETYCACGEMSDAIEAFIQEHARHSADQLRFRL